MWFRNKTYCSIVVCSGWGQEKNKTGKVGVYPYEIKIQTEKSTASKATRHLQNVTTELKWTKHYTPGLQHPTLGFLGSEASLTICNLQNDKLPIYKTGMITNISQDYCEGLKK